MFYEEKIINGILYCRTTPDGSWQVKTGHSADAIKSLLAMSEDARNATLAQLGYVKL